MSDFKAYKYWHKITYHLQKIGQSVVNTLFTEPEFIIRESKDRQGHVWYDAYDPKTGRTGHLTSEEEVHIWIEESFYYRNSR
ncbi:hypothetical protein NIES2101_03165 [Calothrix sp. HK-06]|nr:hypothetical protein NIES2101_03165 [Calothrix sp. HK-06]